MLLICYTKCGIKLFCYQNVVHNAQSFRIAAQAARQNSQGENGYIALSLIDIKRQLVLAVTKTLEHF